MRDQIEKTLWKIIEYNASKIKWWIFKAINENSVTLSEGFKDQLLLTQGTPVYRLESVNSIFSLHFCVSTMELQANLS